MTGEVEMKFRSIRELHPNLSPRLLTFVDKKQARLFLHASYAQGSFSERQRIGCRHVCRMQGPPASGATNLGLPSIRHIVQKDEAYYVYPYVCIGSMD